MTTLHVKRFEIFEHPHIGRNYKCSPHKNSGQSLMVIEEDPLHIREKE